MHNQRVTRKLAFGKSTGDKKNNTESYGHKLLISKKSDYCTPVLAQASGDAPSTAGRSFRLVLFGGDQRPVLSVVPEPPRRVFPQGQGCSRVFHVHHNGPQSRIRVVGLAFKYSATNNNPVIVGVRNSAISTSK